MNIPIRWNMKDAVCDAYKVEGSGSSLLHGHHHFLITLITKGRGVQTLNGEDIPFVEGDLFILSPADFHRNTVEDGERFDYFGVKFPYELLDSRLSELCELSKFPIHIHLSETTAERARSLFETLVEECRRGEGRVASEVYLRALVEQLFILAIRELPEGTKSSSGAFVNRALGYLHSHFHESITVNDAAAYVGYTPNYFNTLFREQMGVPFGTYLRNMRLSYAKNLLLSGDLPVTEIALEAGFGSLAHFSRSFTAAFGSSPKQYRRSYGEKREN